MRSLDSTSALNVRHLSSLASSCEAALVLVTLAGEVMGWLGAADVVFGYSEDEALGMACSRLLAPQGAIADSAASPIDFDWTTVGDRMPRWWLRKDGSRLRGIGAVNVIPGEGGDVVCHSLLVRPEESGKAGLEVRLRDAQALEAARASFVAVLTHELRNQLTPLAAGLAILDLRPGDAPSPYGLAAMMTRKIQVIKRLIDDLADASMAPTTLPSIAFVSVQVQALLCLAADHIAHAVDRRGQTLVVSLPESSLRIEADEHRLDQLLTNLLNNASKFTDVGGTIRLSASLEDGMAEIRVEDDGCGIEADALPRIFDLFGREDRAGSPAGFGVGLAVVKQIAQLHRGTVTGRSAGRRKGSVFVVRLPLTQS